MTNRREEQDEGARIVEPAAALEKTVQTPKKSLSRVSDLIRAHLLLGVDLLFEPGGDPYPIGGVTYVTLHKQH